MQVRTHSHFSVESLLKHQLACSLVLLNLLSINTFSPISVNNQMILKQTKKYMLDAFKDSLGK